LKASWRANCGLEALGVKRAFDAHGRISEVMQHDFSSRLRVRRLARQDGARKRQP